MMDMLLGIAQMVLQIVQAATGSQGVALALAIVGAVAGGMGAGGQQAPGLDGAGGLGGNQPGIAQPGLNQPQVPGLGGLGGLGAQPNGNATLLNTRNQIVLPDADRQNALTR